MKSKENDNVVPFRRKPVTLAEQIIQSANALPDRETTIRRVEIKADQLVLHNPSISVTIEV